MVTQALPDHRRVFFLVMLYGTLEYDGRAKRLLSVLETLGSTFTVDVAVMLERDGAHAPLRKSVWIPAKAGVLQRHLRFWCATLSEVLRHRPSVVVSVDYFTTFVGWLASRLTGAHFVYDAHELIIPEPHEKMSLRDRFWYQMERVAVRHADLIIAANDDRARLMQEHYRLCCIPITMRNIPPINQNTLERSTILAQYPEFSRRNPEEYLILYQGDVSLSRGIDRFVMALAHLPANYRIIVVGDGPDLERLRVIGQTFKREGRFDTLGWIENRLLPVIAAAADVGIVTYPFKGQNNIYCAPNKVFEYAQAGLPVVTTDQPPLRSMVTSYGIGKLVSRRDDSETMAAVIREVAENKAKYTQALAHFLKDHRWEEEAERVRKALAEIVSGVR